MQPSPAYRTAVAALHEMGFEENGGSPGGEIAWFVHDERKFVTLQRSPYTTHTDVIRALEKAGVDFDDFMDAMLRLAQAGQLPVED